MPTKLTLTIDREVIEQAKKYAQTHQRSLSNLIETYLRSIINENQAPPMVELTPMVKSMKGAAKLPEASSFDEKQLLEDELTKKYLG